ncbi:FAD-dependent oxidoreductase [Martelella sp. AMO21009]
MEVRLQSRHEGDDDYDILDNAALRRLVPEIASDVPGASYSRYDGQADPLRLLQAFHRAYQKRGGRALGNSGVLDITRRGEKFILKTACGEVVAGPARPSFEPREVPDFLYRDVIRIA